MTPWRDWRVRWLDRMQPSIWQSTLAWAALIGVLGALATLGLREAILLTEQTLFGRSDGLVRIASNLSWWQRLSVPAAGGIVAGSVLALARRVNGARPGGDYMEAIALGDGVLPVRASLLRALSSLATVATGGAIGREGPMVQLAALAGSLIGSWRRAPLPRRRLMVACGAAAGVATAYNAPIAGALFVAEIVLHSLAIESLGPLLVAAVAANLVSAQLVGVAPVYQMPGFVLNSGAATLALSALGVVGGLAAPLYLALLDRAHALYARWPVPSWLALGSGGLIVGALSLVDANVWGNGYSVVNSILHGGWAWPALLLVLGLKLAAVAATTGSGAVGGIFTPTLFVGAVAGALGALVTQQLWPGAMPMSASVAVGMGAFLSACTHAPLTSVLMVFEMTENFGVLVPSMLACVLAYSISRALRPESIYSAAAGSSVPQAALSVAADFLRRDCATVQQGCSVSEIEDALLRHRWPHVYVVDDHRRFLGAISLHDVAALRRRPEAPPQWPAALLRTDYPRVGLEMPAWQVLDTFATHPGERLPVLDDRQRLVGHVTKTDLVLMLRERLSAG